LGAVQIAQAARLALVSRGIQQLELLVESDERLVPGTVRIIEEGPGRYLVTATTVEFGAIEVTL
ncbi:DUF2590 family protein, partial [Pseudomonas aeruginosa]|uniref:DUF2590 family protein n=1 Tax=Pseudomonas aeruginosa TaxID=287 RepID=UPI003967F490